MTSAGVLPYLIIDGGFVRGVLLWNVWGQVDAARALIAENEPVQARALPGRLPAYGVRNPSEVRIR